MKTPTNADTITFLQQRLKAIDNERSRLVQAINLLTVTELVAQDTAVKRKLTITDGQPKVRKTKNPTKLDRMHKGKPLPWRPNRNAKPFTQSVYDTLADGIPRTTDVVHQTVVKTHPEVTRQQIQSVLTHMKYTSRVTLAKGLWRRKHARYRTAIALSELDGGNGICADQIQTKNRDKITARLDREVAEGRYFKVIENGKTWYRSTPSASVPKASQ
jgi:hypothetical protein